MSETPRITYRARDEAIPEGELNALAAVYKFVLDCHAQKEGGATTAPADAMKGSKHDRATSIISKPS